MTERIVSNKDGDLVIERDALDSTPDAPPDTHEPSAQAETVKSIVMTPRMDEGLVQKIRSWINGSSPNTPIVYKTANGLRRMLLFTSNAYKDRENETITSKALEAYEASCYPGEGLYHNDNPLLFWHDDDIVMGTIEGVEYITPFLIEVGQELPNDPISKALWDWAEKNGDKAGVSHRFGYLEKDRDTDGTFHRIFKQETSYLPERSLAANGLTYAGVLQPMSIPESRQRLGKILAETTGVEDIEDVLHNEGIPAARKRLSEQGLQHKAAKPPFPPKREGAPVAPSPADPTRVDEMDDMAEDEIEEDAKGEMSLELMTLPRLAVIVNGLMNMFSDLQDVQAGYQTDQFAMRKSIEKALEERVSEKAAETVTIQALEQRLKSLEDGQNEIKRLLSQTPRSVQHEKGSTPDEAKAIIERVEKARIESGVKIHPVLGVEYDPSKIPGYKE